MHGKGSERSKIFGTDSEITAGFSMPERVRPASNPPLPKGSP